MRFFILLFLFLYSININAQRIIEEGQLIGLWEFNTMMEVEEVVINFEGTILFLRNKELKLEGGVSFPYLPSVKLKIAMGGKWHLVGHNRIIYEHGVISYPQIPEAIRKYITFVTESIKGMVSSDRIEAFEDGYLILKDSQSVEVVFKRLPNGELSYFERSE